MLAGVITRDEIRGTYDTIRPCIRRTPVVQVDLSELDPAGRDPSALPTVTLKLEQLQCAGSFKTRGAFANLLLREVPAAGVVAASGGNHGAAVAYAAMRLGVPAKIFVPTVSSPAKTARIRGYGADLVVVGERYADALAAAEAWAARTGALAVHAFDQIETLLGQATLWPGAGAPGSRPGHHPGGGRRRRADRRRRQLVRRRRQDRRRRARGRADPDRGARGGAAGRCPAGGIAADSLAPRRVGELMFPLAQAWVERVALVGDDAIRRAQQALWEGARIVAEPGGAAASPPCSAAPTGRRRRSASASW